MLPLKETQVNLRVQEFGSRALFKVEKINHSSELELLAFKSTVCNQLQDYRILFMFCHQQSLAQQVNGW